MTCIENYNKNKDTVIIALDQSKAYQIIAHRILLRKLKVIGFSNQTNEQMQSYLEDRHQFVEINGTLSETLPIGPFSVSQESIPSGLLYQIYTLDLPLLFHERNRNPMENRQSTNTKIKTFVNKMKNST